MRHLIYDDNLWFQTFSTGAYAGVDGRFPRKKRKEPLGFTRLERRSQPPQKRKK